jgi:hypothetical protein
VTTDKAANLPVSAADHLADAQLHLRRALICLKTAATVEPGLLVLLGTPHSRLTDVLTDLERTQGYGGRALEPSRIRPTTALRARALNAGAATFPDFAEISTGASHESRR